MSESYGTAISRRLRVLGQATFPVASHLVGMRASSSEALQEFSMGSMDWGALIGQGMDVLSSITGRRRGGAPSSQFMAMGQPAYGPPAPSMGGGVYRRRRRGGISSRDLRSFRRVANLIRKYAAPVRHFRTKPRR